MAKADKVRTNGSAPTTVTGMPPRPKSWSAGINAHEAWTHDSLDSLGYDWERIAVPHISARFPFRLYLPQSTEEIIAAVKEAKALGERLIVRGHGHSANDLVVTEGGSVLLTENLRSVLEFDEHERLVKVQSGAITHDLDELLAPRGYGLPVNGNENHITVAGFASVGGVSPASHRYGLFVDNVVGLEYVDWDGNLIRCSRTENSADLYKLLCGTGRHGVIATLTLRVIPIDKWGTILRNDRTWVNGVEHFLEASTAYVNDPGDAEMGHCLWTDLQVKPGRGPRFGVLSSYRDPSRSRYEKARNSLGHGYLFGLGYMAGRLPGGVDRTVKTLGMAGLLFTPRYASIKNIETYLDKTIDHTVGDPTRWLVVFGPAAEYRELFSDLYELLRAFRERERCMTFISCDVRSIRSEYLAQGEPGRQSCSLLFNIGVVPERMTTEVLEELVSKFDDICIAHHAFRYMHTRTVKDPKRRALIDPNTYWAEKTGQTRSRSRSS